MMHISLILLNRSLAFADTREHSQYNFEWDPAKAHRNAEKHGITFDRAIQIIKKFLLAIYQETIAFRFGIRA